MLNVLYVDDDPGLLEIGRIFLEATAEFSVDTLTSAADAISRIAEKPFDAIISDYQMPDLNGIAFLKTVRASGNTIPFILFTGRGREEIVIEALNEGADFYIQKGGETQAQFVELAHKIKKAVETRRFEAALRASEIWFRSIIQHASEYILVVNHSGEVTYTSPSYYQRGGYPENSLIGKNPLILVHPDDLERVSREFADSFDPAHIPVPTVYRARKADGTYLWVESLASNLFGIPEIGGIVITSRDITKRKEAEDELYASNQQLIASEEELRRQFDTLSRSEILIRESESRLRFMLGFYDLARKPDKEILTYAVEGAGVITGSPLGYLAFLNDDETELRMYAWSKTAMRECSMREKPLIYPVEKTGLWGEAVRQRRAVITNDYAAPNPKKKGCPPGHPQIVRHMNVPIFDGNHIVMIAGVANRPSDYTENEARHLTLLMQELWQILKRRRVEKALTKNEIRFRSIIQHSDDIILAINREGVITYASPASKTVLGYGEEDLLGKNPLDFVHPDDRDRIAGTLNGLFTTDREARLHEFRTKKADGSWTYLEAIGSNLMNIPGIEGFMITLRDITKRRMTEVALRESEEKFRGIFNNINDAVHIHEIDKNGQPGRFLDVNDVACRMLQYSREELLAAGPLDFADSWHSRPLGEITDDLRDKGHAFFETFHIRKDGTKVPVEINAIVTRILGKKVVVSVIRDITQRKKTEEAIRNAHRQLTLLSSITRHDIRNKVTIQLGLLALAERKARDNPDLEALLGKLESATRAIRDQIEFTRIYQDLGCHDPRWQDLHQVLAKTTVPPSLSVADTCAGTEVFADIMLEKVFGNLIDNAVRHGGNVTQISLSAKEVQGTLVIRFEDNGTGIPEHEKKKIFERGYGKNTGLGLFLAREVLALTGITIAETGTPGKGAQFEMVVPAGAWRYGNRPGPG